METSNNAPAQKMPGELISLTESILQFLEEAEQKITDNKRKDLTPNALK